MSKIFFDHFIEIEDIKSYLDSVTENFEEREDLWNLVDEFINHKVLITILANLDTEYHDEFLLMFIDKPYSEGIIDYLDDRLPCPLCELIKETRFQIDQELKEILEIESMDNKPKNLSDKVK